MGKKKKKKKRLTIEGQLENYYLHEDHTERNEVLWHAWCQNKRWLSQLLEATMSAFPTYSKHDESHASTVLHNIEMILGESRIRELSASDCFMLLHTVYIHDIGMVITHEDRENIVQNEKFLDMVKELEDDSDVVFQKAIRSLRQTNYEYDDEDSKEEQTKRLYADKLSVYYAILHLIANYRRSEHGETSADRLSKWTLDSEKLGSGFSMAGIPQRIFLLIAKCAGLHTDSDFAHIMELPQEDNGYVSDYLHPRFVAVLLQLGDILDMDNDRFHPLTKEFVGVLPEISARHYEKHQAIRRLYIRPDIISIEADCKTQEALRLVRKECDILKGILKEAGYNWMLICPRGFSGALPTVDSVKLYLEGMQIPEELVATQFHISQSKAFAILEGSNVYKGQFVFLREFLQNAIDASKMQYWQECVRTWGYYRSGEELRGMSPDELEDILSTDIFPIEIEMQIVKRNEEKQDFPITEEDIEALRKEGDKGRWEYGVKVRIKDFGTGIDKDSILGIAKVGNSRRRDRHMIADMPEWLKPTAEFGIGLQSAFILTNMFKCYTFTRSNEKYEVTFSTVKSNYYEGYINVKPRDSFDTKDDVYGTCFEVFVPVSKKMLHEQYPTAWDGKDYFDEDYELLRPLRHSAELLAQMALYLDEQIGEQLFPIHLKVEDIPGITIPLNLSDKNRLHRLKCNLGEKKVWKDNLNEIADYVHNTELNQQIQDTFADRVWDKTAKSWIFYYKKEKDTDKNVLIEKTDHSTALLDTWNGYFYVWNNELCTFCTINMRNFLLREQRELEKTDRQCESRENYKGVRIYYKGIELAEIELPDIGNELFQSIDIKGKLAREYINLSRKGFTDKGEEYFLQEIYEPLMESVQSLLKEMNKNQPEAIVEGVRESLERKKRLLQTLSGEDAKYKWFRLFGYPLLDELRNISYTGVDIEHWLDEAKQELLDLSKENVVLIVMLSFLARKGEFNPILRLSCDDGMESNCCWNDALECVREYSKWLQEELKGKSILFEIEHRPEVNLQKSNYVTGKPSHIINLADIFSDDYHFMVVSKRENVSVSWKQYLTPFYIKKELKDHEDLLEILKQYTLMDSFSTEKMELEKKVQENGQNALEIARSYGVKAVGMAGEMSPGEYLQQYFMKWMLQYVPTAALFMSEDGNTRVNILSRQIYPFIFVNQSYKASVVRRIMEEVKRYGIQRYSIPAWQRMEYLKCKELPYTHYFVKRGYLSRESYGKLIFPFGAHELQIIMNRMNSPKARDNAEKLEELLKLLNNRQFLFEDLQRNDDKIKNQIGQIQKQKKISDDGYLSMYYRFKKEWENGYGQGECIVSEVRDEYRSFVMTCIKAENKKSGFSLSEFWELQKQCEYIHVYILLMALCRYYGEEKILPLESLSPREYSRFAAAWLYVIRKEYMTDASEIAEYKDSFLDMMKRGTGDIYHKQQKILEYIAGHNSFGLTGQNLWSCWMRCIEELLDIFIQIEMSAFSNLGSRLTDLEYFEKRIL